MTKLRDRGIEFSPPDNGPIDCDLTHGLIKQYEDEAGPPEAAWFYKQTRVSQKLASCITTMLFEHGGDEMVHFKREDLQLFTCFILGVYNLALEQLPPELLAIPPKDLTGMWGMETPDGTRLSHEEMLEVFREKFSTKVVIASLGFGGKEGLSQESMDEIKQQIEDLIRQHEKPTRRGEGPRPKRGLIQ